MGFLKLCERVNSASVVHQRRLTLCELPRHPDGLRRVRELLLLCLDLEVSAVVEISAAIERG